MTDLMHGEGIFQCRGCGHTYSEYVNGCPRHDGEDRKVILVVSDAPTEEGDDVPG